MLSTHEPWTTLQPRCNRPTKIQPIFLTLHDLTTKDRHNVKTVWQSSFKNFLKVLKCYT